MNPQIILDADGKPAFAVIPYGDYYALVSDAELSDEELFDRAQIEDDGERFPHELMARLVEGDVPLKVYREWRGLTQEALAEKALLTPGYISQVERRTRHLSRKTNKDCAAILGIEPSDLMD